jgi:glycosyltransferase involved in cell wall biosynthesis
MKKRILFVTAFKPSRLAAGENYTRQLLIELGKKYDLDLVYFKRRSEESLALSIPGIRIKLEFNLTLVTRITSYLERPFYFPVFKSRLNKSTIRKIVDLVEVSSYDLIFIDYSQTFELNVFLKGNKILLAHDVMSERYGRHGFFLGLWAGFTERKLLRQGRKQIFTFSAKDSVLLRERCGVDSMVTGFFLDATVRLAVPDRIEDYLVFFAMWRRKDNLDGLMWFLKEVLPFLKDNLKIKIIGAGLSSDSPIFAGTSNVEYLGFVDNPYEIIKNARALIAPLFKGAGVKVKVVEALACGVPIVGTPLAFEGIDDQFNSFMLVAQAPKEYVTRIDTLDLSLNQRLLFKQNFISSNNSNVILDYISNI